MQNILTATTPALAPRRPWTVIGYADATPTNIGPDEVREIMSLKDFKIPNANAVMQIRTESRWSHCASGLKSLAIGGGIVATCAALSMPALYALAGPFILSAATSFIGAAQGTDTLTGTRTFDLSTTTGQAQKLAESKEKSDAEHLANYFVDTTHQFPSSRTAFYMSGHGLAYHGLVGLSMPEAVETLDKIHQKAGRKTDVVIMDACLMGNLETMKAIAPHARYAVASEESVGARGMPLDDVLSHLPAGDNDALAVNLVASCQKDGEVPTLSMIDLEQVEPLSASMEKLAGQLMRDKDERQAIQRSLRDADGYPADSPSIGLKDIGQVLKNLESHCQNPQVLQAVHEAQAGLKKAVASNEASDHYADHASGLTIQGPAMSFLKGVYDRRTGMNQWGEMLQQMRPWPVRMVTGAVDKIAGIFSVS